MQSLALTKIGSPVQTDPEKAGSASGGSLQARYQARLALGTAAEEAKRRYESYARHHDDFVDEVAAYLYGSNPHEAFSLASLAWKVTIEMNRIGRTEYGWAWNPNTKREELAPGLLTYLQLICETLMPPALADPTGVRYRPIMA